ncbi:hypothetical protein GTU79_25245 [Sodalis ligni]|uniref:hypothetical protein n=1 Tax=Sodalis ligni TaxID=2697027 RepID=UPI00193F1922|nr:hypothetical protein [Sodalis ligni]QWA10471.1 hypothetical protein GTU79_25245 [Sodalis ligni]
MFTPTFTAVMARIYAGQEDESVAALLHAAGDGRKSHDPLALRLKPGVREFVVRQSAGLGISASGLINLILEGVIREMLLPFENQASHVYERFQLLMEAHGLGITEVATLLAPFNIRLGVLEDRARTLDYLNEETLDCIAGWFNIDADWLKAKTAAPVNLALSAHRWRDNLDHAAKSLLSADSGDIKTDVYFFRSSQHSLLNNNIDNDHHVGLYVLRRKSINGVSINTVRLFEQAPWSSEQARSQYRMLMGFCALAQTAGRLHLNTVALRPGQMMALRSGVTLPALIAFLPQTVGSLNSWRPEENLPLRYPDNYMTPEWRAIANKYLHGTNV